MKIAFPKFPKKTVRFAAAASVLLATAVSSVKIIRTNEFGLQETTGVVTSGVKKPGVYFQVPFAQITHAYRGNTQTISFGAGSFRFFPWNHDTADKNILVADVTINYKVIPDPIKLSFWRWAMEDWFAGANGYWVLTEAANTSANAALGRKTMAQTLSKPAVFAQDLYQDLSSRLEQNNIPIQVQSIELNGIRTTFWPAHTTQYIVVGSSPTP